MRLSVGNLKHVCAHASEAYPYECFGFLVGAREGGGLVRRTVRGANVAGTRADRFEMDAHEFLAVDLAAEVDGLEVIGFYHSHPDWPALPSQSDLQLAWISSQYLIVSVHSWHPLSVTAWQLSHDEPSRFEQIPIEIVSDEDDGS